MAFGRRKKNQADEQAAEGTGTAGTVDGEAAEAATGPFDVSQRPSELGYVDLGAIRIASTQGLQLRLEIEERSQRIVAVTLDLGGSTLQLQAFAAPRSEKLWDDIRGQISQSVAAQGGAVDEREGTFGTELLARVPAQAQDGSKGYRVARFVGFDGPRWFLRGVFGGPAAMNAEAAAPLEEIFRSVVVVRGDQPLPPRDLLQLRLPKDAAPKPAAPAAASGEPGTSRPDAGRMAPPERGPEITTIG